jgi:DNA-cytosine methyltransferase
MRIVDLFSGAGGVASGFQAAGACSVLAADFAPHANLVHAANFPETAVHTLDLGSPDLDLRSLVGGDGIDVVVGGPPCQDYSTARLKGEDQGRKELTVAYVRHAVALAPTWIVLENVPMARKSEELARALALLDEAGYVWRWEVVSARTLAGMAQNRRRLVVLARQSAASGATESAASDVTEGAAGSAARSVSGSAARGATEGAARSEASGATRSAASSAAKSSDKEASGDETSEARRVLDAAWAHLLVPHPSPPQTMRECFAAAGLACPTDHVYIPACNQKGRRSIYPVDGPAPTVRTLLRPLRLRYPFLPQDSTQSREHVFSLTLAHMAALQGFPPTFQFPVPKTHAAKCIGNAVPPPVAERIARALLHASADGAASAG